MAHPPEASIVVVHHRGLEHLLEALEALEEVRQRGLHAEVLLVDNASDTPLDAVLARHPDVRRIRSSVNAGFASGCRLGVEAAASPTVLFVNDDAVVEPDAPRLLVDALGDAPPDVVAVGGRLTDRTGTRNDFSDGFLTFDGHAFAAAVGRSVAELPAAEPGEDRLFACGGLMAVRRDDFLSSGGFDDDYFAYLEDVDFGWRQWIFGRRVVAEPRAVARHRGGATGEALGVFSRGYLFEKNAFATVYKNLDAEHFRDLMPAVLMTFLTRSAEMLLARNPGASELDRDPYASRPSAAGAFARQLFGIAEDAGRRVVVDDPLTLAQLRALAWVHRHHAALAEKRRAVQAGRRRSDAEIFARFPLRLVPTYPGDDRLTAAFFAPFFEHAPDLVRTTLSEIFEERG